MIQIILGFLVAIVILMVLPYLFWYKPEFLKSIQNMF